jgi:hypothetical protein
MACVTIARAAGSGSILVADRLRIVSRFVPSALVVSVNMLISCIRDDRSTFNFALGVESQGFCLRSH